jgi:hypothetical protein
LSGCPSANRTGPAPAASAGTRTVIEIEITVATTAHRALRLCTFHSTSAAGEPAGGESWPSSAGPCRPVPRGKQPPLTARLSRSRPRVGWSASLRRPSPDDTLRGREAGGSPAQSRYGDHRLHRPRWKSGRRPRSGLLNPREKG